MLLLRKKKRKRTHACLGALRRHGTPENRTHQRLTAAIRSCMDKRRPRRLTSAIRSCPARWIRAAEKKKSGDPRSSGSACSLRDRQDEKRKVRKNGDDCASCCGLGWAIGQWRSHAAAMLKAIVLFTNRTSSIAPRFDGPTSKTF